MNCRDVKMYVDPVSYGDHRVFSIANANTRTHAQNRRRTIHKNDAKGRSSIRRGSGVEAEEGRGCGGGVVVMGVG